MHLKSRSKIKAPADELESQ